MAGLTPESWAQIAALAGAVAVVVGLVALARVGRAAAEGRIERRLLAEQLREQERALARLLNDTRHTVAAQLTALRQSEQRAILTGVGRLHQAIERRLGDLQTRLAADAGDLRAELATQLGEIGGRVDQRLAEGFERTTETFGRVLSHLARIDEAQKRITELSSNVLSLKEILGDKRSRGALGETQLAALVRNLLPEGSFALQHTLANGTRVDCLLRLPAPTGDVPIDAKFPLESYRQMTDADVAERDRQLAAQRFRQDVRRHVEAIADKYLLPGETADGAVMFIPAEAVFAEIHARFPDLVEDSHRRRVWMASPTTLMAILTTALAVLKDDATRRQVHVIRAHLRDLADDFARFQQRMDSLARHIAQAHQDVDQVATSARRISGRFGRIERVEIADGGSAVETASANRTGEPVQ
jgi:DNA recombination protein RmuC